MRRLFRLKPAYWAGLFLSIITTLQSCKVKDYASDSKPIDHGMWDKLTKKHVTPEGYVDYEGFLEDSVQVKAYLALLSNHHPNDEFWSRDERLAYWINAYNAFTVKLIMDHYPVQSIKDIKNGIPFVNTVWDIQFIDIEERTYDLNNIEHGIIRPKFEEPRIHFAVNCASVSCPRLRNEAYTAERLDEQLTDQTKSFLADESKNKISKNQLELSKLFTWYGGDFTKDGQTVVGFVQKYSDRDISDDAKVDYIEYNWDLNIHDNYQ
jgi:hypothetical protein